MWVPHVENLDDGTGRFGYVRRAGTRTVLRLTGTLAATYARGTVARNPLLAYEPHRPDIVGLDEPCG